MDNQDIFLQEIMGMLITIIKQQQDHINELNSQIIKIGTTLVPFSNTMNPSTHPAAVMLLDGGGQQQQEMNKMFMNEMRKRMSEGKENKQDTYETITNIIKQKAAAENNT